MERNKTGRYLKYAIGEVILVVIGILIALQINNWNQKNIEATQIRNIYARVVQDFNSTANEIDRSLEGMDRSIMYIEDIINGEMNRDSILAFGEYHRKYASSFSGFPDIQIKDTGIRLLESRIALNYELNNTYNERLIRLYSEYLYEIEVDLEALISAFKKLGNYLTEKGIKYERNVTKSSTKFTEMVFEDDLFKNYLLQYLTIYRMHIRNLKQFRRVGQELIDTVKVEYSLD